MKSSLFITLFLLFCTTLSYSQDLFRNYSTLAYNKELLKNDQAAANKISIMERQIARTVRFGKMELRTIPVIFHVLHANPIEKISISQIEEQIAALNTHFSLTETVKSHLNDPEGRYAKRAVDTQIRFCLATEDVDLQPMDGIRYIPTTISDWTDLMAIKQDLNGANPVNPSHFLNIWVVHLPDDNAGFAQMPGGPDETDGIVIDYRYVGPSDSQKYGQSKSLTFLLGQFLGLYPLTGAFPNLPCSDDYVDDTPRSNAPNIGCPSYNHISTCDDRLVTEMTGNFMSHTNDNCRYFFTRGQAARMQAVLDSTGVRSELSKQPTACKEDFLNKTAVRSINQKIVNENQLNIFPNPADNQLFIELFTTKETSPKFLLELLTINGKVVSSQQLISASNHQQLKLDISHLPTGLYLVKVKNEQTTLIEKVTIE